MKSKRILTGDQVLVPEMPEMFEGTRASGRTNTDFSDNLQLQKVFRNTGMGGLQLPFAPENETLEEAMRRMRSLDRRALVIGYTGPEYLLHMNQNVLEAYQEGFMDCTGLRRFEGARVAVFGFEVRNGEIDFSELSPHLFERFSTDYGLLFEPGSGDLSAYLLARTDELANSILYADEICRCMKNHPYYEPPPVHGTTCQHDQTEIKCI